LYGFGYVRLIKEIDHDILDNVFTVTVGAVVDTLTNVGDKRSVIIFKKPAAVSGFVCGHILKDAE
jgi:hypothetical protein